MKYFLIMNPGSKAGKSQLKFNKIFEILDKNKVIYDYKITNKLEDAYTFSQSANKKDYGIDYDVIVAVGGDGTINMVINGFYDLNGKRISNSKFAVIYTGTSPDFCKSYGIPIKVDEAVNNLIYGKVKKIQIGKIIYSGNKISYFACCVNIGIGALVARNANNGIRKYVGDYAGTFISIIKSILGYKACEYIINIDGNKQKIRNTYNLSIGITKYIASGIKIKNNIKNNSKFYILNIRNIKFTNIIGILKKIYSGKDFVNNTNVSLEYIEEYTEKIEIFCAESDVNIKNSEIEFDGDDRGFLPCIIESAKDTLDLIVR